MATDPLAKVTCPICLTTITLEAARKNPQWHCVSTGVLGSVKVEWYCQECYEYAFHRRRHSSSSGSTSGSNESTL